MFSSAIYPSKKLCNKPLSPRDTSTLDPRGAGGFPAGAVQVVATIFDESNTEIADGSTTFDDPSQDLETQANLVPGDEGQDYTVSLVVTLSNGVVCDAVVLDLLPDCSESCPPRDAMCV